MSLCTVLWSASQSFVSPLLPGKGVRISWFLCEACWCVTGAFLLISYNPRLTPPITCTYNYHMVVFFISPKHCSGRGLQMFLQIRRWRKAEICQCQWKSAELFTALNLTAIKYLLFLWFDWQDRMLEYRIHTEKPPVCRDDSEFCPLYF